MSQVDIKRRHVWAVWFCFFCCGFLYSQFTSRMPALEAHAGTDEAGVGVFLMCFAAGSLTGLLSSGFILRYVEARTMLRYAITGFCLGLLIIALLPTFQIMMAGFAFWGFCCAFLDIGMNSQAMYLEAYSKRNYMATMHANYSVGCVLGSGVSAVFAWAGLSIVVNYCSLAILLAISFWLVFQPSLLPDPKPEAKEGTEASKTDAGAESGDAANTASANAAASANASADTASADGQTKQRWFSVLFNLPFFILLCGSMSFLSYTAEGSVAEWGSLVMHTTKNSPESLAALAYGVLACTMALTRFGVDRVRNRVPDVALISMGASLAGLAIAMVIWTDSPLVCLICYGVMGVGLAPISPIAFSRAGASGLVSAKTASLIIGLIGYAGFLIVPPILGYIGAHYGLERALFIPLGAVVLIVCLSLPFKQSHRSHKQQMFAQQAQPAAAQSQTDQSQTEQTQTDQSQTLQSQTGDETAAVKSEH